MIALNRTDRSAIAQWWWTADRWLLAMVVSLIALGVLLSMAASPAVAERIGLEPFHFVYRQLTFVAPALLLILCISLLKLRDIKRLAVAIYLGGLALMILALFFGPEIKGAHRWLNLGPLTIQPSEFVKPAFTVLAAWMMTEGQRHPENALPSHVASALLFAMFAGVLVLQPDFGQTLLVCIVWGALYFMAGMPYRVLFGLVGLAVAGAVLAYLFVPHVTSRIDRFVDPDQGDTYQIERAIDAFEAGGLLGAGPAEGLVKLRLPDAHTDFILAVVGEEYGLLGCLLIAALFLAVVIRALWKSLSCVDPFARLASAGLAVLLGLQAVINMMVNLSLMPAKGMTLPFVSYGGSSMLALAVAVGFLIGLTRFRPAPRHLRRRPWAG